MGLLQTVLTDGGPGRWRTWLRELWRRRRDLPAMADLRDWSSRTIIALVMQSHDNSLTTSLRRGLLGRRVLTSRQGHGAPNPTWIPAGNDAARRMARRMGGMPGGTVGEPFDVPMTAHILGGCAIGTSPQTGVIDPYHRVHGQPGLHVMDGSAVSANLGVNPSLTITALAERACALWPNAGTRTLARRSALRTSRWTRWHRGTRGCPRTRRQRCARRASGRDGARLPTRPDGTHGGGRGIRTPVRCRTTVFKTVTLGRSVSPPGEPLWHAPPVHDDGGPTRGGRPAVVPWRGVRSGQAAPRSWRIASWTSAMSVCFVAARERASV